MFCKICGRVDVPFEHMARSPEETCRACAYRGIRNGADLAEFVNAQASNRLAVIRAAQARRAPSHPVEAGGGA